MRELRPYQTEAIAAIRARLSRGCKRPVLQLPTGGGKTAVSGAIIRMARAKGTRVMFVVPAISLIDQTVESFRADGLTDIGVIQASHWLTNPAAAIQVCSIQTLERRELPVEIGLVIVDECHRSFRFLHEWMALWPSVPFIGLSATPWTAGMGKHWDDLIVASDTETMIANGYLSPFKVYAPCHPDLKGVRTLAGDYHEGDLGTAMDKPPLIADIVRMWKQYGNNQPTLLFAVNCSHAMHCKREFEDAGINAGYIDANTDQDERRVIADQFHAGELRVVCNVGCLTTGVDWDVRCIILARPTKSESLFVQMIGRGLRTAEGKTHCIIIDHSDTHQRLGFVTDIRHEELDDGSKKAKEKPKQKPESLPRECKKCHYLMPPKSFACPACGARPEKQNSIEHIDGELRELTGKKKKPTMQDKQDWYSQFLAYADAKQYKPGWAANAYRDKFGVWPRGLSEARKECGDDVYGYIRHMNIRKAKAKEAGKKSLEQLDRMFQR